MNLLLVNNKGYILPFSLMLTSAVLFLTVSGASVFVSRFSYLEEMESGYKRESMILYTTDSLMGLQEPVNGAYEFTEGTILYNLTPGETLLSLSLTAVVKGKSYNPVIITYSRDYTEILEWK